MKSSLIKNINSPKNKNIIKNDIASEMFNKRKTIMDINADKIVSNNKISKPFIKWAGGKGSLLEEIRKYYPKDFGSKINKYAEPFLGGGAVLFDILNNYKIEEIYVSDLNKELVNAYKIIQNNVSNLIEKLITFENEYIPLDDDERKSYYYDKRKEYNNYISKKIKDDIYGAALFIFLNRTCFNGLYRVNSKGEFNVPIGKYKNPKICDEDNLISISNKLKNVNIVYANYSESNEFIDERTLVYFDPPYRPLSGKASFTSYSANGFNDDEQLRLAQYFTKLDEKGAKLILSNSDPKNTDEEDNFFEHAYSGFNINRIKSKRRINSNANKRGNVSELLITNIHIK